ncbi:aspartyl/asparaginyl beta-hydroxylase domain-containing protein [Undibacterium danionis]|uniref:Aspartyl/asparaginyl beta-hydroxylase domain-containing protein n=1 Tax=Undibacterium danionis TaxID=1812100 RepID=A0ABV6IDB6_9BURK
MSPSTYLRLPFSFDLQKLKNDLAIASQGKWISHFNTSAYERDWSCIPLRSVGGHVDHILPIESDQFADTFILERCTYFQEVIQQFACEKTSIRLMSLAAGGEIKEHRDAGACLEDGITRLHIPIQTSPDVLFRIDGEEVHFSAGNTWYLNASCLHGVRNPSPYARVHLMMDCITNPWLEKIFLENNWVAREKFAYEDPTIDDANVTRVIEMLLRSEHASAHTRAKQLQDIFETRNRASINTI